MDKKSSLRTWVARVLSIVFVLFLMVFSLDVFEPGSSIGQTATGFLVHNIPALILAIVVVISWKFEIVGGIAFMLAGIAYIGLMLVNSFLRSYETGVLLPIIIIALPALLIGGLYILNWAKKKR